MPDPWFQRTFECLLSAPPASLRLFPVWLLLGPRQVGKTSLLQRVGQNRNYITLDDLTTRQRANGDPALFAQDLELPLTIDEIQYAPALLSPIKQLADQSGRPGAIWLTGSQNFQVMEGVRESLAGRVALLNLLGLSDHEKRLSRRTPVEFFEDLLQTGFPRLWPIRDSHARELYLSSYTQTYIERDVRELLAIDRRREFEIFLRLCAARTGQVVNYDELARSAGVSAPTVKNWLSVLEDSFVVYLARAEASNRTKRLTRSPKLYFLDAGLAAHLAGWRNAETLRLSPQAGMFFETHLLGEILKTFRHSAMEVEVRHWRTRDGDEIDFLVETNDGIRPIEVKMGSPTARSLPKLETIRGPRWHDGQVVSLAVTDKFTLANGWQAVPLDGLDLGSGWPGL